MEYDENFLKDVSHFMHDLSEINERSEKEIIQENVQITSEMFHHIQSVFKDDEDAQIEMHYHSAKMAFDIIVETNFLDVISISEEKFDLLEAISKSVVFSVEPIDNERIKIDFGSPPIYRRVE